MPLIFICAMKTASTCIPRRELAKINAGLTYTKVKEQTAIFISLSTDIVPPEGESQVVSQYSARIRLGCKILHNFYVLDICMLQYNVMSIIF